MKDGRPPGTSLPRLEAAKKAVGESQPGGVDGEAGAKGERSVKSDATTARLKIQSKEEAGRRA